VTRAKLAAKRELLVSVLDTLVPPSGDFPESGALAVDHVLAVADASAEAGALLWQALEAIEEAARGGEARGDLLRQVERGHPEAFDALVRHTYDGFYSHPATITRLGLEPGPVQPRGHRIESAPVPDLGRVVGRGPIFRRP
jgi:hypothetical protein